MFPNDNYKVKVQSLSMEVYLALDSLIQSLAENSIEVATAIQLDDMYELQTEKDPDEAIGVLTLYWDPDTGAFSDDPKLIRQRARDVKAGLVGEGRDQDGTYQDFTYLSVEQYLLLQKYKQRR